MFFKEKVGMMATKSFVKNFKLVKESEPFLCAACEPTPVEMKTAKPKALFLRKKI